MATPITTDHNIYSPKNQLVTSDLLGRTQLQELSNDWVQMLVTDFSYVGVNIVGTNFDARKYFQIGDRIRIIQSSTYKYFYIVDIVETYIKLVGGSDTFTSAALTNISFSRLQSPLGISNGFDFNTGAGADVGIVGYDSIEAFYSITGNICGVFADILNLTFSSAIYYLEFQLPFDLAYLTPQMVYRTANTSYKFAIVLNSVISGEYFLKGQLSTDSTSGHGSSLLVTPLAGGAYGVTDIGLLGLNFSFPFKFRD